MTQSHRDLSQVSLVAILHSSCDCNLFYFFGRVPIVRAEPVSQKARGFTQNPIGSRAEPACRPRPVQSLLRSVQWLFRPAPVRRPTASDLANPCLILNATPFAALRRPILRTPVFVIPNATPFATLRHRFAAHTPSRTPAVPRTPI